MADLVNLIAQIKGTMERESFVTKAKNPVAKLVGMYVAQVG